MAIFALSCRGKGAKDLLAKNAAERVYVAPGDKDEVYLFTSGGFNGQIGVQGIPSGRLIKTIPVFSVWTENGYGFSDETKQMLNTSHGYLPWDDSHHIEASQTKGKQDGRWIFINGNNTPRIARISLESFETEEIIEIPNSAGNHASPFLTENTEYAMAATRFSVPIPQRDIPIESYGKGEFHGTITMVGIDAKTGKLSLKGQVLVPGYDYDLSHCGKGPSHDWCFFTTYNTEQAHKMLEIEASKNDKDFILAFNWKKAEACFNEGKGKTVSANYVHNMRGHNSKLSTSKKFTSIKLMNPKDCDNIMYYMPTPKSPHGVDIDPTGEYIVGGGKLATVIPVHSFSKLTKAIQDKANFSETRMGIPVLKYEATLAGEVQKPCLGPLHTEFDGKGYAYTSCFVTSEIVKWELGTWEVKQNMPAYYAIGHLSIVGGDSAKPYGKYLVALNKITKDRYLPTGPELVQSAQLWDISGSKAELLLDFPTQGEPHYAQMIPADLIKDKTQKIFELSKNEHPYAAKSEKDAKVVREGNVVHVYMTAIRSHFKPDTVELKVGDTAYFHVTNLEQDYDIPHGFAIYGAPLPNILIMPGQTLSVKYEAKQLGIFPFYCTDFCSALHQEMQQYVRVSK
ncbi:MAG TPA: Sec-dependent nitrous-oxide reductase [Turneriella sp.]|nr:Sec-dependent nitrous-oxide reductase [Turneriella sp.]